MLMEGKGKSPSQAVVITYHNNGTLELVSSPQVCDIFTDFTHIFTYVWNRYTKLIIITLDMFLLKLQI